MTERADYIRGLCQLASLLYDNDDLSLPSAGPTDASAQSIFIRGASPVTQALLYIQAMDEPPTMTFDRQSHTLTWLDIKGHIEGLHIELHLRANDVCERRVTDVYRDGDGNTHEIAEWVIPAELVAVATAVTR